MNDVFHDELEPFGDMHLELSIVPDEFLDDFVEGVVELKELVSFVVFVRKDVLLQVHLHVVEQLEKELANSKIFANHLSFQHGHVYCSI